MSSNSSNDLKWVTIGKLWKDTKSPHKLKGEIEIKHLGLKFEVWGFIKTPVQKKYSNEEDIRISTLVLKTSDEEEIF